MPARIAEPALQLRARLDRRRAGFWQAKPALRGAFSLLVLPCGTRWRTSNRITVEGLGSCEVVSSELGENGTIQVFARRSKVERWVSEQLAGRPGGQQ